jgi:hypothetical protein
MAELPGTINLSGARIVAYIYGFSVRTGPLAIREVKANYAEYRSQTIPLIRNPYQGFQFAYWSPTAHEGVVSQTRHQTNSSTDATTRVARALAE